MSDVKRYKHTCNAMMPHPRGYFVRADDYDALAQRCRELEVGVKCPEATLADERGRHVTEVLALRAEVERLCDLLRRAALDLKAHEPADTDLLWDINAAMEPKA